MAAERGEPMLSNEEKLSNEIKTIT